MLKLVFVILTAITISINVACCCLLKNKKTLLSRRLIKLNLASMLTSVLYVLTLVHFPHNISILTVGLYNASILRLLIVFFDFSILFTDTAVDTRTLIDFRRLYKYFFDFAIINFFLNIFLRHAMEISVNLLGGKFFSWRMEFRLGFYIHLTVCYFLVFVIIAMFFQKIRRTNKFYRNKYIVILCDYVIAVIAQGVFLYTKAKLDFSIFFFESFIISATYFSFYFFPREIENKLLSLVAENITNAIFCFDMKKICIYENAAAEKLFKDKSFVLKELDELFSQHKKLELRNVNAFINGEEHIFEEEFHVITDQNEKMLGCFIMLNDITEEIRIAKIEKFKATHDMLTGLYNRRAFFEKAEDILKASPNVSRYMISTNIKDFKFINDLFGSDLGDKILVTQAKLLDQSDETCIGGRISDDKLALILNKEKFSPEVIKETEAVLQKEMEKVNYKIHLDAGVYEITNPTESVYSMYDKTMLAIKSIRENYNQSVAFYDPSMLDASIEEKRLVSEFEHALLENQFQMYLQAQILSSDQKVVGAEALVRWHHPSRGIISPAEFIEVFERRGYVCRLDNCIWECAAKKLSEWKKNNIDMYIAVNISAKDFYHFDLYDVLTGLVKKYDISPDKLRLEVTETVLMQDISFCSSVIERLQKFGFLIETDDFGSGYSSFALLQNLKTDILKIDMAFLYRNEGSERSKKILAAIIEMGKKLGMSIIAEGVENADDAEFLKSAGCDMFQGYLYSEPILVSEFEKRFVAENEGGR